MLALNYYYEFTNDAGIQYKVGFFKKRSTLTGPVIVPTSLGFSLNYSGPTNETYQPIISSEATFELIYDTNVAAMIEDIITSPINAWFAIIYKWNTITEEYDRWWNGPINTENITTPDASISPPVDIAVIRADDGFGYLENILYVPVDTDEEKDVLHFVYLAIKEMTGNVTIEANEPFLSCGCTWYDANHNYDLDVTDPLLNTLITVSNFQRINEDGDIVGYNYKEILENILNTWRLWIFQNAGKFVLMQPEGYVGGKTRIFTYEYADPVTANVVYSLLPGGIALPADRGTGGTFSNAISAGKVTSKYEYKTSIYGDSLLPNPPEIDVLYTLGLGEESLSLHIEGTIKTNIYHPTGFHIDDYYEMVVFYAVQCGAYVLDTDNSWVASPGTNQLVNRSDRFKINYKNINATNTITIDTEALPDTGSVQFEIERIILCVEGTTTEWTDPTGGHTLSITSEVQQDWQATIGNDGALSGEVNYYAEVDNGSDVEVQLQPTIIGDGYKARNISKLMVLNGQTYDSTLWLGNVGSATYPLHQLRCVEALALNRGFTRYYDGRVYAEIDMLQRWFFIGKYWIVIGATYYANDNEFDVTLMALELDYTDIDSGLKSVTAGNSSSGGIGYGSSVTHPRLHSITSSLDHAAAAAADYGKYLKANASTGLPEWSALTALTGVTDGIFDLSDTAGSVSVSPYAAKTVGGFDSGSVLPDGTTRINWNGYLYAKGIGVGITASPHNGVTAFSTNPFDFYKGAGVFGGNNSVTGAGVLARAKYYGLVGYVGDAYGDKNYTVASNAAAIYGNIYGGGKAICYLSGLHSTNGLLIELLKNAPQTTSIPIIVLTASDTGSNGANGTMMHIQFNQNSNPGLSIAEAARILQKLDVATVGSETSSFEFWLRNEGAASSKKASLSGAGLWTALSGHFGSATNYTAWDTDGHQMMVGNATVWEDLRIEPTVRGTGSNNPSFEKYIDDAAGTSRGVFLYSFDDAVTANEKEVYFTMQMPHAWAGTSIQMHVHWIGAVDDTTAAPKWGLEYSWSEIGAVFPDSVIVYTDGSNYTGAGTDVNITALKHYISKFSAITPGTGADGLSSILIGRLFRNSGDAGDTYDATGAKAGLLYIDAHYEANSLGSNTEYTK